MSEGTPSKLLPRLIDPRKFAQNEVSLQGDMPVSALPEFGDVTLSAADVAVEVAFSRDEENRYLISGSLKTQAALRCQRCLEPVHEALDIELALAVVWDEEDAKHLPKRLEPWITTEGEADFYAILEEELLLALPTVALHDEPCLDANLMSSGEAPASEQESKDNPFQVLEQLKSRSKK